MTQGVTIGSRHVLLSAALALLAGCGGALSQTSKAELKNAYDKTTQNAPITCDPTSSVVTEAISVRGKLLVTTACSQECSAVKSIVAVCKDNAMEGCLEVPKVCQGGTP